MRFPNRQNEKQLWQQGYKYIAGLDEAGKGSWAGPLVAAAVILNPKKRISGLRDSKLLSALARERLYEIIVKQALGWSVGIISHKAIDETGITAANISAMTEALKNLKIAPDYLLIDAVKIRYQNLPAQSVIDGDYKIASVAAASIIAKVTRDRLMVAWNKEFPAYGFAAHKGYGTKKHYELLCQHGVCRLHRQSFEPMKSLIKK